MRCNRLHVGTVQCEPDEEATFPPDCNNGCQANIPPQGVNFCDTLVRQASSPQALGLLGTRTALLGFAELSWLRLIVTIAYTSKGKASSWKLIKI